MTEMVKIIVDGKEKTIDLSALDLPPPVEVLPLLRTSLFKTEIYSRMTDDELDAFDDAIEASDRRTRLMWRDCLEVQVDSPLWPLLQFQMKEAFGAARTAAILSLDQSL